MSNFVGYFKGTGAVNNQPNESKIKTKTQENKEFEFFKLGVFCEGAFLNKNDDIEEKKIEVERIVGVEAGFNWLPIQNYLRIHSQNALKILKNTGDMVNCNARWYRIPSKKTVDAVILGKDNIQKELNGIVGDFCFRFNAVMGVQKKLHTKPFDIKDFSQDTTPTL